MTYKVNEIFYSIQGEGYWTGHAAVFCRFASCNLWSGNEEDRAGALCTFCDTKFTEYTEYSDDVELAEKIDSLWPGDEHKMVVFTGGEPMLQLDRNLLLEVGRRDFYRSIETNGTRKIHEWAREEIDWICVSPKTRRLNIRHGDELKLVYPQAQLEPEMFSHAGFDHFWLSPMDGPNLKENTAAALDYIAQHQQWRLNIQTHKVIGVK